MSNIKLVHSGGNSVSLTTPDSNPAANRTFKLPGADGTSGQAMVSDGSGALSFASLAASSILQLKQVRFTGTQASTSSYADVSGLSITITPTNVNTQMILIMNLATYHLNTATMCSAKMVSSNTGGDTLNYEVSDYWNPSGTGVCGNINQFILDDHNTTSAITYKVQYKHDSGSGNLNKDYSGTNNGISTFTVIEIDSGVIF